MGRDGAAGALANYPSTRLRACGSEEAGQVQLITLENGTSVLMTYDGTYGRLSSLVNRDKTYQTMTSFEYTYNNDGYVTQVERENGDTIDYQYDGVGRLMDEWRKSSGAALVYRNRFQYDAVGNRTQWVANTPGDATTYNYTYNTLNQLTQRYWTKSSVNYTEDYSYDLNGNLTQKDEKTATVLQLRWEYAWDDEDRLISVVKKNGGGTVILTVEYAYCPACGGNRTQKRVWNGTKTDENLVKWLQYETEGLNQLRVDEKWESPTDGNDYLDALDPWRTARVTYNGPGQISQLLKEDVYTYDSRTTSTPSNVTTIYYNYDRMGVVAGLSNGTGSELEQFESDAFGSWDGKNTYTTRRITGKEYDEDVQLYFFHARWYAVSLGRFLVVDPVVRAVGCAAMSPAVMLDAHHIYALGENAPTQFFDPTGRWSVTADLCLGWYFIGGCLHVEIGCNPGGGCCWFTIQAGLGAGAGVSVNPMGTHECPPDNPCGDCRSFGLTGGCRGAVTLLIAGLGYENYTDWPLSCDFTDIQTVRGGGWTPSWINIGARIVANCTIGAIFYF